MRKSDINRFLICLVTGWFLLYVGFIKFRIMPRSQVGIVGELEQEALDAQQFAQEAPPIRNSQLSSLAEAPPSDPVTKLTLLLPVTVKDFPRLRLLDSSFSKWFDFTDVEEFLLIVQDEEYNAILEKAKGLRLVGRVVITPIVESKVVPEFIQQKDIMGWMKQQIIKLAAYRVVKTEYYMTLDSDVICTRPVSVKDLFLNGKAKTNMEPKNALGVSADFWWDGAEKTIGLKIPKDDDLRFGVTPAILSKTIVHDMSVFIQDTYQRTLSEHLVASIYNSFTEYTVYYVFAAAKGLFKKYHAATFNGVYKEWALSVWWPDMFDRWDGKAAFSRDRPGYFILMQSNTKIPPETIWDKVKPFVEDS